jgi:anti-anti-sigma factor
MAGGCRPGSPGKKHPSKEVRMTGIICDAMDGNAAGGTLMTADDLSELVRGEEQRLVERMAPVVRSQSVLLDLRHVRRIDAAGIAALITLYGCARETGHDFTVLNVTPRVAEILALVGLDRILLSHNVDHKSQCESCFERPAA